MDKLSLWLIENNLNSGINIDEDTKRYYPNNCLVTAYDIIYKANTHTMDEVEISSYTIEELAVAISSVRKCGNTTETPQPNA